VRSLGKIFLYALLVLLAGALAAPPIWHLIHALPSGWLFGLAGEIQKMPFHRYLSRSIQVSALLLLWPLIRSLHIRSLEELGLHHNPHALGDIGLGLAAGIPSMLLLVSAFLISGAFELHSSWAVSIFPRILLSALVVAMLEEFVFRGVILGFLRQALGNGLAIFGSAVIFAGLHFLNLPSSQSTEEIPRWWSGLDSFYTMGRTLPPWPIMAWAVGTLVLAGIILAWMTTRTGSLWASIALHACWIFGQQFFNSITSYRHIPADAFLPFAGPAQCHGAVPIGLDAIFSLLLAGALSVSLMRKRARPREFVVRASW
jgi:membrane protease YdiL (CAAX protease family)